MVRVRPARIGREPDGPARRSHDDHVADATGTRFLDAEVCKDLESSGSNQISIGLVAWEARLVDERDTGAAASQDQRGDAAGRTCAHN
jgi:hypothetical protein